MTFRKIIKIDEEKCNGCGDCIVDCAEGALELVNGKAKLVKDVFCDGLGACIGSCPTGALVIEEREAEQFSEEAVKKHLAKSTSANLVSITGVKEDKHTSSPCSGSACPGSAAKMNFNSASQQATAVSPDAPPQAIRSELNQWPVQLHLVQPGAPYFKNKELVVLSTCGPVASADLHWRFMRGRSLVVACPKLDNTDPYVDKLAAILSEPSIPKVIVVRMEVPCCQGLTRITEQAASLSGRSDLALDEITVATNGDIGNAVENSVS